jgi:GNAT superfamily N-acetyltransferase
MAERETADDGDGSEITLAVVDLDDPRARALEAKHIEEMKSLYGGRGPGPLTAAEFVAPDGCFVVAVHHGADVGCGGFHRIHPAVAEIKRMFVERAARGAGVGRRILRFLEQTALAAGCDEAWLETGSEQPPAIALYTAAGYRPIPPYGEFKEDDRSRCFRRTLGGDDRSGGLSR